MSWLKKILNRFSQKTTATNNRAGKSFDEIYEDEGAFTYFQDGFVMNYESLTMNIKWNDITEINVYKADLMTIDEIRMEIICGDKTFLISEELPGWFQFVLKQKQVCPSIPKDWDIKIIDPAFAANYTTIYKKLQPNFC
jgi:hypothetical protein